jgi:hypothetical protein
MTEDINEKIMRNEYLKKVSFKFANQWFLIVFIMIYYLYFVHLSDDFQINDLKLYIFYHFFFFNTH